MRLWDTPVPLQAHRKSVMETNIRFDQKPYKSAFCEKIGIKEDIELTGEPPKDYKPLEKCKYGLC